MTPPTSPTGVWQGALHRGENRRREIVVVQELLPVQAVQQAPQPGHVRQPRGGHLLQAAPQGALPAQGRQGGPRRHEEGQGEEQSRWVVFKAAQGGARITYLDES